MSVDISDSCFKNVIQKKIHVGRKHPHVKNSKNKKSPGEVGYPNEFY